MGTAWLCHRLVLPEAVSPCPETQPPYRPCEEGLGAQLCHHDLPQCVPGYLLSTKAKHRLIGLLLES